MKRETKCRIASLLCALCICAASASVAGAERITLSERFYEDRALIARVIECTAPDASYTARQAIAAVIVNRTTDARFPDDVRSVIYERGAFSCVDRVDFEQVEPSELSLAAARDALLGFDVSGGALYFARGHASEADGACLYHSGFLFYLDR